MAMEAACLTCPQHKHKVQVRFQSVQVPDTFSETLTLVLDPSWFSGDQQPGRSQHALWCKPHKRANSAVQQHPAEAAEAEKQQPLLRPQRQAASVYLRVLAAAEADELRTCCIPRYCPYSCSVRPASMTGIWMLTLSPPERSANAASSVTANQAPLMLFVPKNALNLAGMLKLQALVKLHIPGVLCMQCQLSEIAFWSAQTMWSCSLESSL